MTGTKERETKNEETPRHQLSHILVICIESMLYAVCCIRGVQGQRTVDSVG